MRFLCEVLGEFLVLTAVMLALGQLVHALM